MSVQVYWQIDVAEDASRSEPSARPAGATVFRDVRAQSWNRYDYYAQIAQAAAQTAFDGVFLPYRPGSDDSGIVAAAIAREVPRISFVTEFPATAGSAVYGAKQAVSFQRATHDRLGWAIVAAEDAAGLRRIRELLHVARGVHAARPFSFKGSFFEVQEGGFAEPLNRSPFPPVFLRGDGEEALALSARAADVHLFAAAPFDTLRSLIEGLDRLAAREGRDVAFGLVQPVLVREEASEARHDAERCGLGAHAIVGSYEAVASRLASLVDLGISHLVLGAPRSLEEAYRVGQHVLPRLRATIGRVAAAA